MTAGDVALAVFTACNSGRLVAYAPQILRIARDDRGADAISYTTWTLFALSHVSTVAYAVLTVDDWKMAAVFGANTLCCIAILAVTAYKRARFARSISYRLCLNGRAEMDGQQTNVAR